MRIPKHDAEAAHRSRKPVILPLGGRRLRKQQVEHHADRETGDAHAEPERGPAHTGRDHRPDDELAGGATGHAEHLRGADQCRRTGGREVGHRDVRRADQREDTARALNEAARVGETSVAAGEHQRTDADRCRADRNNAARSKPVHRDTGNQAERGVAVVEKARHRRDAGGRDAERLGELRHHHGWRRAKRVLVEVVHSRHEPGDGGGAGCLGHADS